MDNVKGRRVHTSAMCAAPGPLLNVVQAAAAAGLVLAWKK